MVSSSDTKIKVLIIEDDEAVLEMYSQQLVMDGFNIIKAVDGTSGLSKAIIEQPDIILLDIIIPELDGFEVLHRLKSNVKTLNIPVVLLSNLSQPEQIAQGRLLGAKDYLVKSNVVPSKLVQKIKEFLV